ncbi:MAG: hypothetical protein KAS82_03375 [Bacteroidales bacterium]|nr:hypothetical protein [Bacteroidales bacterium]
MQEELRKIQRRREVLAGFTIILVAFSYVTSLLLDFNFVSPYATLQEDLSYLANHLRNQQISVWAWLITSMITFLAIPPYLLLFHKRVKVLHYVNAIWLLGASAGFLMMGIAGIELYRELAGSLVTGMEETDEQVWIKLLGLFQDEQFYRRIGSSFIGLFAFGLGLTRFKMKRFPFFAMVLLMICGPTMIFFNWYDPNHLIRTAAMAGILIGVSIFSVRVINKGL